MQRSLSRLGAKSIEIVAFFPIKLNPHLTSNKVHNFAELRILVHQKSIEGKELFFAKKADNSFNLY